MEHDALVVRIVDAALAMAEEGDWEGGRLREVAERLDVPLTEVLARFRDLDAVADAWFRRGWDAMLAAAPDGFIQRPPGERVEVLLCRWFDALAPHRRVTGRMLLAKLYPSHPPLLGAAGLQPIADYPMASGHRRSGFRRPPPAGRGGLPHRVVLDRFGRLDLGRHSRTAANAGFSATAAGALGGAVIGMRA
jgi:AcrR family transcriptional regulator